MSHSSSPGQPQQETTQSIAIVSLHRGAVVKTFDDLETAHRNRTLMVQRSPNVSETDYGVRYVLTTPGEDGFIDKEHGREYTDETDS